LYLELHLFQIGIYVKLFIPDFGINLNWLIAGEGEMFVDKAASSGTNSAEIDKLTEENRQLRRDVHDLSGQLIATQQKLIEALLK
jgi:cell division protein FtsB